MPERMFGRRTAITTAVTTAALAWTGRAQARPRGSDPAAPAASGRLYELRSGRHRVVIGGVAATVLSWQVDGAELLLTHAPEEVGEGYRGKTILPWPNRIDQGRYRFGGQSLQVPINEPSRQAALHGLMSFTEWSPVRVRPDGVVLQHRLPPQYGYPFSVEFHVEYTVDGHGLRSRLTAHNTDDTEAPFGTANHTYIAASGPDVDALSLTLPAETYYVTDDRLIPTGTAPVAGTQYDFRSPRALGRTTMDTAFTGLAREPDGTALVRFQRPGGHDVELRTDRDYLQVYTDDSPETDRPARAGITVEPMTCAPNAFVTGDGLITLAPGDVHESTWTLRTPA